MEPNHVLVSGHHNRQFEVHKDIQAAFPDDYPLVKDKPKRSRATTAKGSRKGKAITEADTEPPTTEPAPATGDEPQKEDQ